MDWTPLLQALWLTAYFAVLGGLCLFGAHRYVILFLHWRHRHNAPPIPPAAADADLPFVTVQLPIFNEAKVVRRLLESVGKLDYPRDRFEIQILDDSTDETRTITQEEAEILRQRGLQVELLQRNDRTGFKAGALAAGQEVARGELIYIADADFVPPADALRNLVGHFEDETIGMVQTRWGHLNRTSSILTRLQAIFLDGHFQLEQTARNRSDRFFHFNGTGGMWRKSCIVDAGGWAHETLTEDLDLSLRAQMKGWKFIYRNDLVTPAELPSEMSGFKTQQHRWAKGAVETCRKLLVRLWRSPAPLRAKIEASVQLTCNFAYLLMAGLVLLMLRGPQVDLAWAWLAYIIIFWMTTGAVILFYTFSTRLLYPKTWVKDILHLPMALALGIGMCVNNSKGVLEAVFGHKTEFVRTPKFGSESARHGKRRPPKWTAWLEAVLCVYFFVLGVRAVLNQDWMGLPFLLLFVVGFGYVAWPAFRNWIYEKPDASPTIDDRPRQQLLGSGPAADELH
ncbi:MAG: cellulose synthase/poly-beta-1,6-N-acetylglucosamine synthase-like glycosyltransferase [Verrucomicrobiales bacterium]